MREITLTLNHFMPPDKKSIYKQNRLYWTYINHKMVAFKTKTETLEFIIMLNREINFFLNEINFIIADAYTIYRVSWIYGAEGLMVFKDIDFNINWWMRHPEQFDHKISILPGMVRVPLVNARNLFRKRRNCKGELMRVESVLFRLSVIEKRYYDFLEPYYYTKK